MDAIKNAIGLNGKESQQGQEPVSGVQGAGTATEPFDSGNRQDNADLGGKAPQHNHIDTASKASEAAAPSSDSAGIANPEADTTQSGKSDHTAPQFASPKGNSESPSKKASIGTPEWFKTAMPSRKLRDGSGRRSSQTQGSEDGQSKPPQPQASHKNDQRITFAEEPQVSSEKNAGGSPAWLASVNPFKRRESKGSGDSATRGYNANHDIQHDANQDLAPNHLAPQVPTGHAKPAALGELPSFGNIDFEDRTLSTEDSEIQSPKQDFQRRSSKIPQAENPSAIPTAGGVQLGQKAMEDRRKSQEVRRKSQQA